MKRIVQVAIVPLAMTVATYAHEEVTPKNVLTAWTWELGVVIPLLLSAILYFAGSRRARKRNPANPPIRAWQIAAFWSGWCSLVVALVSPVHRMGEVLFAAHMTQHELLMVVAAPLFVLGRPLIAFLFALPLRWRVIAGQWSKSRQFTWTWSMITGPLFVWALHGLTIWIWHIPALYQATLDHEGIHALQHSMFLLTALLFWWTLIHGRYGRLGYGVAFAYVFTTALHTSILGALMTFTQRIWYPLYDGRTLAWNLTPLQDQQLGGLIMWIPSGTVFIVVGLAMFAAWIGESERRQRFSRLENLAPSGEHDAA